MLTPTRTRFVAVELTPDDVGDVSELPGLLDQIDAEIASLTADGAYDGEVVYDTVANRHPDAEIIIPPRATAVPNESYSDAARSAYCNDRKAWPHGLAAPFWLQPPEPGRDCGVSVQDHHWPTTSGPDSVHTADRGKDWMQRAPRIDRAEPLHLLVDSTGQAESYISRLRRAEMMTCAPASSRFSRPPRGWPS